MSAEPTPEPSLLPTVLRREALLPNERNRGLGTVAVVCTMAGVASGLALATTLMAMQVADSMTTHCPYARMVEMPTDLEQPHGYLGVTTDDVDAKVRIIEVNHGTPAEAIGLARGDIILAVDGVPMDTRSRLMHRISSTAPGTTAVLTIEHDGAVRTLRPTLATSPHYDYH